MAEGLGIGDAQVFDFLKRSTVEVVEAKASATGRVVGVQTSGRVAWSPRDTVSL